jgi:hypothetical protein
LTNATSLVSVTRSLETVPLPQNLITLLAMIREIALSVILARMLNVNLVRFPIVITSFMTLNVNSWFVPTVRTELTVPLLTLMVRPVMTDFRTGFVPNEKFAVQEGVFENTMLDTNAVLLEMTVIWLNCVAMPMIVLLIF